MSDVTSLPAGQGIGPPPEDFTQYAARAWGDLVRIAPGHRHPHPFGSFSAFFPHEGSQHPRFTLFSRISREGNCRIHDREKKH